MKIGDTIKCCDIDDLLETMEDLAIAGIETDFLCEKDGETGLWLEVVDLEDKP